MNAAGLLALSDERDQHERLRHAAFREGYVAGGQDEYDRGYVQAVADVKRD